MGVVIQAIHVQLGQRVAIAASGTTTSVTPGDNGAGHPVVGTYFLHKHHVGSTQVVTDHAGKVVSRMVYSRL
jgi:hypothetical protein